MADDNENPLDAIKARADEMGLDGDERDDYIRGRMQRAGFKKGPGEWIREEDDEDPRDDDDEPVTRGEMRRMRREQQRKSSLTPPKKTPENEGESNPPKGKTKPRKSDNPWWE